ncbi:ribokinase [Gordonia sp. ABSL1-1]|uniref:ribokinase n=1 Tax=Gordonia sp. ABSL1-1 TaxID=3053923 RepID=UPI0025732235|nr:ribokinase [Gordonia sp. ABSL1-1]MDL9938630.1 ribokinase [Gordonia sp. ABSL1-1]
MTAETQARVAVVGTLNMDMIVRVERRPAIGETVIGSSLAERAGGKGANQALAAATVGAVALIGAVGDDDAGAAMVAAQRSAGVDVTHVAVVDDVSGRAVIEVDAAGDNSIIVVSGANGRLSPESTVGALESLQPDVVLTQLESPPAVTAAVADWCRANRRRFVLNPSPVAALPESIVTVSDPLVVNEIEATFYADAANPGGDPRELATKLLEVATTVVITLGPAGVVVATPERIGAIAVEQVPVSDTTGAGDHFAGVLVAHLANGVELHEAAAIAARSATAYLGGRSPAGG